MDRDVISAKLEALRRCVQRIESRRPATLAQLEGDIDMQDILSINLERAIQQCVDLAAHVASSEPDGLPPTNMAESFGRLARSGILSEDLAARMRGAVGFRNISVHAYQKIDWAIVYSIVTERLEDFREFARAISRLV